MEEIKVTEMEYENALKRVKEIYEEKRNLLFELQIIKFDTEQGKLLLEKKKLLDKEYAKNKVLIRTYELENYIELERGKNYDKYKRK